MRVRVLLGSLADVITEDERARVEHLIDHGEAPDGLVSLAAIIVNRGYTISREEYESILRLVEGTSSAPYIPAELGSRIGQRVQADT